MRKGEIRGFFLNAEGAKVTQRAQKEDKEYKRKKRRKEKEIFLIRKSKIENQK
jgi:hypothetical protein